MENLMNCNPNMDTIKNIHFIGIGGAGMGGIAEVMVNLGYQVSGSDLNENSVTKHLSALGAKIVQGHLKENILGADLVVQSSAIPQDNPEVVAAKLCDTPVIPRAKMLALLMQTKYGIAISGTHGKTTTTSLVASILAQADLHPTFVIGGLLKSVGTNAQLGTGQYFVAEADESDASFLYLKPKIAVITNIDSDHLSTYNDDIKELRRSFLEFACSVPKDGLVVLCADDPIAYSLCSEISAPCITYGFHQDADLQISSFQQCGLLSHFRVHNKKEESMFNIVLNLAGKHNALNALAAIAVSQKLDVNQIVIKNAFQNFMGIGRRFQMYGEFNITSGKALLIDDYGHHPREIAATLDAIRLVWPKKRLVMAYQPHRYTRTHALMNDFAVVLSSPDVLLLLDVYSAGEAPIIGADGYSLCHAISNIGKITPTFIPEINDLPNALQNVLQDGDILLLQGAGSIGTMALKMASQISCSKEYYERNASR
jgi:UDP-N-acetylmuramate--alanine ligase